MQFSDVTADVYAKSRSQSRSEIPTQKGAYPSDTPHNYVACFPVKLHPTQHGSDHGKHGRMIVRMITEIPEHEPQ